INIPWFNKVSGQTENAVIPAKTIMVNGPKLPVQTIQSVPQQQAVQMSAPQVEKEPKVIQGQSVMTSSDMWLWLIIGLIGGGLIVGLATFILHKINTHKRKKPLPDLYPF
ncbi:MAG: hypothetical protein IKL32_04560, partial [Alphaproteobacteria bacterium]|nr:hypothetical protein [Alphaproteobacteria bacterium]